jgi:hypothetical protein
MEMFSTYSSLKNTKTTGISCGFGVFFIFLLWTKSDLFSFVHNHYGLIHMSFN